MDGDGEPRYAGYNPEHENTREFLLMIPGAIIIVFIFGIFFHLTCRRCQLIESMNELASIEMAPPPPRAKKTTTTTGTQTIINLKEHIIVPNQHQPSTSSTGWAPLAKSETLADTLQQHATAPSTSTTITTEQINGLPEVQ